MKLTLMYSLPSKEVLISLRTKENFLKILFGTNGFAESYTILQVKSVNTFSLITISTTIFSGLIEFSLSITIPSENSSQTRFYLFIELSLKVGGIFSLHGVFGCKHSNPYSI